MESEPKGGLLYKANKRSPYAVPPLCECPQSDSRRSRPYGSPLRARSCAEAL